MSMPDVSDALWGLVDPIRFRQVSKEPVDYEVVETLGQPVWFDGNLQPIKWQELAVKPEGQRQWKWWTLWCVVELPLDYILEDSLGKRYRVMAVRDWSVHGYYEYELAQGPLEVTGA